MAVLLVSLSVMAVLLTVAMPVWRHAAQREKEAELVFRGMQYARAVNLFQRKYPGTLPPSVDALIEAHVLRRQYKDPITGGDFQPLFQGRGGAPGAGPTAGFAGRGSARSSGPGTFQPTASAGAGGQRVAGAGFSSSFGRGAVGRAGAAGRGAAAPAATGPAVAGFTGVQSKSTDSSIRIYNGRTHYNEWAFVYQPPLGAPGTGAATPGGIGPGGTGAGRGFGPGVGPGRGSPFGPGRGRGFQPTVPPGGRGFRGNVPAPGGRPAGPGAPVGGGRPGR